MAPFGTRRKRRACTQSTRRRHYRRQLFKSTSMKQVLESPTSLTTTLTSIISSAITTNVISSGGSSSSSSGSDHRALKIDYDQCLIMRVDNEDIKMNNNTITISDCLTPKAERFRIPDIETCPPAPKKRRVLVSSPYCTLSSSTSSKRSFFTSPDIELFFYFAMNNISA